MTNRPLFFLSGLALGFALKGLCNTARPPAPAGSRIRSAGPEEMIDPPRNWNIVDEQGDESFPASDPPANY